MSDSNLIDFNVYSDPAYDGDRKISQELNSSESIYDNHIIAHDVTNDSIAEEMRTSDIADLVLYGQEQSEDTGSCILDFNDSNMDKISSSINVNNPDKATENRSINNINLNITDITSSSSIDTHSYNNDNCPQSNEYSHCLEELIIRMQMDELCISPKEVVCDGKFHRCGTRGKENKSDGAYIIHTHKFIIAYWKNWRTGAEGRYTSKRIREMSSEERQRFEKELNDFREQSKSEKQKKYILAKRRAQAIWNRLPDAPQDAIYLTRKGIKPNGLKWHPKQKKLVLPIYGKDDELQSLQFISTETSQTGSFKTFMPGGEIKGGYFPIPAAVGKEDDPILICEGFATGASLHEATGYPVYIALFAGNLKPVALLIKEKFPNKKAIICGDYDQPNEHISLEGGSGVYHAKDAASASGFPVVIAPAIKEGKGDFNDLHVEKGLEEVSKYIFDALTNSLNFSPEDVLPKGFYFADNQLFYQPEPCKSSGGLPKPVWICTGLRIIGQCRDGSSESWGIVLEWCDPDNKEHTTIIPYDQLIGSKRDVILGYLQSRGLYMAGTKHAMGLLCQFLLEFCTSKRIKVIDNIGWVDDSHIFTLPNKIFGQVNHNDQIMIGKNGKPELYKVRGSYENWKEIPTLCIGNNRMEFALFCAFAGPLLYLAKMESGGFLFRGQSSSGKTTMLYIVASVWGIPVLTWRATDNAIEGLAAMYSDTCLLLDELGQGDASPIGKAIYTLAQGIGKQRMNSKVELTQAAAWRLLLLSTGEIGLGDKFRELGASPKAGQSVRFCEIPTEKSDIINLHSYADGGELAKAVKKIALTSYGHAAQEFLNNITKRANFEYIKKNIEDSISEIADLLSPPQSDGQVRRVAARFALVAYAGQLAIDFGILPEELKPMESARACFNAWLDDRGGIGPAEDMQILEQMRLFLERHGLDRFRNENVEDIDKRDTVRNMVGFRVRQNDNLFSFFIMPASFNEIMEGHNPKMALKVLAEEGWLIKQDQKRFKTKLTFHGYGQIEVYHIRIPNLDMPQNGD